jgi:hypothetical protein
MLAAWTEILPLFIVRWLARNHCERVSVYGEAWVTARPGVLVKLWANKGGGNG